MVLVSMTFPEGCSQGAVKAEFSDGSSLLLGTYYLPDCEKWTAFSAAERELTPAEEEDFLFASACYRAEKSALRLIARAEQCSLGLMSKLEHRGYSEAVAKRVVSRFTDNNLLDDRRYAEIWIRSRLGSKKALGPRWLLAALGKKGIDRDSSKKALEKVLDYETEHAYLIKYLEMAKQDRSVSPGKRGVWSLRAQLKYAGFSPVTLDRYFEQE